MKLYAVISKAPDGGIVVVSDPISGTPRPLVCTGDKLSSMLVKLAQAALT